MKKKRRNVQLYTKSGGGGTLPVGLGQAGAGIFFIVDALDTKAKGYDVVVSFPREGIGTAAEAIALLKGAKNPEVGKKLIDWAASPAMQSLFAKYKINFVPAHPEVEVEAGLAAVLKARGRALDQRGAEPEGVVRQRRRGDGARGARPDAAARPTACPSRGPRGSG
jgi:iron(III) transport system substrate-binding protein